MKKLGVMAAKSRVMIKKVPMSPQPVQAKLKIPVARPAKPIQSSFFFMFSAFQDSKNSQVISMGKKTEYTSVSELSPVVRETKKAETANSIAVKKPPALFPVILFPMKKPGMTVKAANKVPTKKKVAIKGKLPKRLRERCQKAPNQLWNPQSASS